MSNKQNPRAISPSCFARTDCLFLDYCDIAIENAYAAIQEYRIMETQVEWCDDALTALSNFDKYRMITVVFSAMCLEAFFNNYAATCLGDNDFYDNFDKLSCEGKFELICRFILKVKPEKGKRYYQNLQFLLKERNKYVHSKSHKFKFVYNSIDEAEEALKYFPVNHKIKMSNYADDYNSVIRSLQAVYQIAEFFDLHDKNANAVVRLFNPMIRKINNNTADLEIYRLIGLKVENYEI